MRYALKFAYNGFGFHGYARQPDLKTIEGDIIKNLIKNGIFEDTKEANFRSASRTDKDVSSLGNVVAFNSELTKNEIFNNIKNSSDEIVFFAINAVSDNFNPRFAKQRHYRYYLENNNYDLDRILSILSCFIGTHDFTNFARVEEFKNPVRNIENILIEKGKKYILIDFFAPNFLWSQIKRIISATIKCLKEKIAKEEIVEALNNPEKNVDFGSADSKPLILLNIFYDFEFEIDKDQIKKVKKLEESIIQEL